MILFQRTNDRRYHIDAFTDHVCRPLDQWNKEIEQPYCFYYSIYEKVGFCNFLDQQHTDHLKQNPDIKVVYDSSGESLHSLNVDAVAEAAKQWAINRRQIVFLVLDQTQEKFVKKLLKKSKIYSKIKLVRYNPYLEETPESAKHTDSSEVIEKRFSLFCRRHRPWRTYFVMELFDNKLLDEFHFSYHGIDNCKHLTVKEIVGDVITICKKPVNRDFKSFLDGRPHTLDDQASVFVSPKHYLDASDLHIVIEHAWFDEEIKDKDPEPDKLVAVYDPDTNKVHSLGPQSCFPFEEHTNDITEDFYAQVVEGKIPISQCHLYIPELKYGPFLTKTKRGFKKMTNIFNLLKNFNRPKVFEYQPHFVSEKTYKAVCAKKPFLVLSTHQFLGALRQMGFSTFAPHINESYDLEVDPKKRIAMIVDEIKRINSLDQTEYQQLIENCQPIAEKNYQQFKKMQRNNRLEF